MTERIILHIDINHCFAQIEEMLDPSLRDVPMCVGGDVEQRQGIVTARNLKAKAYGVASASSVRDARLKCPHLVVIPPKFDAYHYYTEKVKDIYRDYSNYVQSFGLDEAWVDITDSYHLFVKKPFDLAKVIQDRVLAEIGLTVSVGLSWNKVFAKLGSDLIKPSGLVYITEGNYKEVVFPLPVETLLYVGQSTKETLNQIGIYTIGELATAPIKRLQKALGKRGLLLHYTANGIDDQEVQIQGHKEAPKSISNGTTYHKDIASLREAQTILMRLCESVATRLNEEAMCAKVVSLSMRDTTLHTITRQKKLTRTIASTADIYDQAVRILKNHVDFTTPLRSMTVAVSGLIDKKSVAHQMSLFDSRMSTQDEALIDTALQAIRQRFGFKSVKRASALLDAETENFNPIEYKATLPNTRNNT